MSGSFFKLVIIQDLHPIYDSDPEPFGFHELPCLLAGLTIYSQIGWPGGTQTPTQQIMNLRLSSIKLRAS